MAAPAGIKAVGMAKRLSFVALLLGTGLVAGCASNSARLKLSPCAGCDFEPVNRWPVAECRNPAALLYRQG